MHTRLHYRNKIFIHKPQCECLIFITFRIMIMYDAALKATVIAKNFIHT